MARAVRTFNTDDCKCAWDHDSLEFLIASTLHAFSVGILQFGDERDVAAYIAELAEQVGWVQAGDEVEDLRQLLDGVTGLDEVGVVNFEDAQTQSYEAKITNETQIERVGLAVQGDNLLMVRWEEGENPQEDPATVIGVIRLSEDARADLIHRLQNTSSEEDDDS